MGKQRIGSHDGAIVPVELHAMATCRVVGDMQENEYGWTMVMVDSENRSFVYNQAAVYENPGELWPHFIQKTASGYRARLMSQGRVTKIDSDMAYANNAVAIQEVEF